MMTKGFPVFGRMQDGAFVEVLKNYTLPDFILKLIAKTCNSTLLERGRLYNKLQSMNDESLELLYKIFVECKNDDAGKFTQYRFYAYVSSFYPKCEVLVNHSITGLTCVHKVAVAIKSNATYVAVAINKVSCNQVNKKDITKFFEMIDDIKNGECGESFTDAIYCSSVGFRPDALESLNDVKQSYSENKIYFKTVIFDDGMYSLVSV
jgi:hypothetical protein